MAYADELLARIDHCLAKDDQDGTHEACMDLFRHLERNATAPNWERWPYATDYYRTWAVLMEGN